MKANINSRYDDFRSIAWNQKRYDNNSGDSGTRAEPELQNDGRLVII